MTTILAGSAEDIAPYAGGADGRVVKLLESQPPVVGSSPAIH